MSKKRSEKSLDPIYYVYRYIRLDTNMPFYVGKGKGRRAYDLKKDRNQYFKNIVNSIPYIVEFMFKDLTEEQAFVKEKEFTIFYKNLGYCEANLTLGGGGVSGLIFTESHKNKISNSLKGKPKTKEHTEKAAAAKRGVKFSEEHKMKLSIVRMGNPGPNEKKVINIATGIIWDSVRKAAEDCGIGKETLARYLRGERKNKTNLRYLK